MSRLTTTIAVLTVLGLADATYLTYVHYAGLHPLCLASGGCETVQASSYAKLAGVPVALIGLIGYLIILGSLAVRGEIGRLVGVVLTLGGTGFSVYLTYLELFRIHAICQWCVVSAVIMVILTGLMMARYLRGEENSPHRPR